MNVSDVVPLITNSSHTNMTVTEGLSTSLPTQADTTMIQVVTTAAPASSDSTVITVVIVLILLTIVALAFLLYRYLCHNKGAYRTTGELAPGEDPDDDNPDVGEKKEYFI
ncbi:small cell adhesion glycoprotein-like isoform X1 [Antennarius striatus]|uniref:small cell adhesion glycoprotein-like isoform X1 n=1 Tax=Antennarius striatus TaxID=241820 RepID=UPI0035B3AB33